MPIDVKTAPTLLEAAKMLSDRGARFLSGGTLVMRAVNEGDITEGVLVRTTDPAYREIRAAGSGRVELGAGATMAQVLGARELAFLHPVARSVGGPAVRAMATVGGNLFAAAPYGDFAAALLALDATVTVLPPFGGVRHIPLEEFLQQRLRAGQGRAPEGLVTAVSFARPASADAFRYLKVSRVKPKGISVLSIAAHVPAAGGRVAGARVALGAMGPVPLRAKAAERALDGRPLDRATVVAAAAVAAEGTDPATDAIASAWYRREVLPVHFTRLLAGGL